MKTATKTLDFPDITVHTNVSTPRLVEASLRRGEGMLAANGALCCDTGERTGRSPNDKFVEDTPAVHDAIAWGNVNRPISPENFAKIEALATAYMSEKDELFRFNGYDVYSQWS
jgi:phosphoenolpyruvate carboxykinase (ATP)